MRVGESRTSSALAEWFTLLLDDHGGPEEGNARGGDGLRASKSDSDGEGGDETGCEKSVDGGVDND